MRDAVNIIQMMNNVRSSLVYTLQRAPLFAAKITHLLSQQNDV